MESQDCEYELLWALWLCKLLKIKLEDGLLGKMENIKNPLIILVLLFDYRNNSNLNKTKWIDYMVEDELYGPNWILWSYVKILYKIKWEVPPAKLPAEKIPSHTVFQSR